MNDQSKRAAAFLRDGKIYLHPYSKTVQGFWIFSAPVVVTMEASSDLGHQILSTLSQSLEGVQRPDLWEHLTDPLLKVAGQRSFGSFASSAKAVEICTDRTVIVFTPTKNGGPRNAFLHLNSKASRCQPLESEAAAGLRRAFTECE